MSRMRAIGYARLSRDEDKENYDSIVTQNMMIESFCREHDLDLVSILEDDNISGYSFNRPGLNQLKRAIEKNEVDIIIAKDLSRIGRHNAKTLLFLEYLEEQNIRIILIHDNYDSDTDEDDVIGIKTWYNERYLKDISRKIKSNLKIKQEDGMVVKVPYGYERDPSNKHALIIDEEAAQVVRRIFKLYIDGYGGKAIAKIFNEEGIPPPSKYHYLKTGKKPSPIAEGWHSTHVIRIIKNDTYIGIHRNGKTKRKRINGPSILVDHEQHIVHDHYHDPIIPLEEFELAQKILNGRKENGYRGTTDKSVNLFTGFLECADCGAGFMKKTGKRFPDSYICTTNFKHGSSFCSTHKIHEKQLIQIILDKLLFLRNLISKSIEAMDKELNEIASQQQSNKKTLLLLEKKIKGKRNEIKNYSKQLAQKIIPEMIAAELIDEAQKELILIEKNYKEMLEYQSNSNQVKEKAIRSKEIIDEIIEKQDLTRRDLEILIRKINVKQLNMSLDGPHPRKPLLSVHIEWDIFVRDLNDLILGQDENQLQDHVIDKRSKRKKNNEDT